MFCKTNKYRNIKTTRALPDGSLAKFDSKREAARWDELCLMQKAGAISNLQRQVKFSLDVNSSHICNYICDFSYDAGNKRIVEDVKGVRTAVFIMKKKLLKALFSIDILET